MRGVERDGGTTAAAAQLVLRFVGGDAEDPASETAAFESGNRAESREKRFLGGVLCGTSFTDQTQTKVEDGALIPLNQTVECVEVAVL